MARDLPHPVSGPRFVETEIGVFGDRPTPPTSSVFPDDLLQESARRFGIICLVTAGVWIANLLLVHFVYAVPGTISPEQVAAYRQRLLVYDVVAGFNVLLALGLLGSVRYSRRTPRWLFDLALGYEVFLALSVGVLDYAEQGPVEGVSWIAVIILLFAAVLASSPRRTLVAALAAASAGPAAGLIWRALGVDAPGNAQLMLLAIPNYICAGLAFLISRIINGLGREVSRARRMGSYILGDLIARGGMGEVWQATHRLLVRPAAIKLIRPEALDVGTGEAGRVLLQRFRREARAAAALHSPHTIQLFDFGIASDGTFYYVMELLNGLDLERLVAQYGPLPPARAIHILRQVCESLGEAHDRGLVHRDIKPANIQVCRVARDCDHVKVLDFGLVKTLAPIGSTDLGLTEPSLICGTPAYLSPEAALGERTDGRSDLYSLGCVAFWMLTGRRVFEAEGVLPMIMQHAQRSPEPPSQYAPVPVPPALDQLVLACLAKDPAHRPQSAWELAERLEALPVDPLWTREDARRWWESRLQPDPLVSLGE